MFKVFIVIVKLVASMIVSSQETELEAEIAKNEIIQNQQEQVIEVKEFQANVYKVDSVFNETSITVNMPEVATDTVKLSAEESWGMFWELNPELLEMVNNNTFD